MGKNHAFIIFGFNKELTKIVVLHQEMKKPTKDDSLKEKS
jgi:hypothetical protein